MNFAANVQEHATPLAGAGVETGVEVHVTGDVADSAAIHYPYPFLRTQLDTPC